MNISLAMEQFCTCRCLGENPVILNSLNCQYSRTHTLHNTCVLQNSPSQCKRESDERGQSQDEDEERHGSNQLQNSDEECQQKASDERDHLPQECEPQDNQTYESQDKDKEREHGRNRLQESDEECRQDSDQNSIAEGQQEFGHSQEEVVIESQQESGETAHVTFTIPDGDDEPEPKSVSQTHFLN